MVHPSLVEGWLIDQERERAEEELDRNRKRVRPDSVPLPNKSNRRGRRSRHNESFADASKHEDRAAPQGLVLRRSTRRTRATKNSSLSNAAQLGIYLVYNSAFARLILIPNSHPYHQLIFFNASKYPKR